MKKKFIWIVPELFHLDSDSNTFYKQKNIFIDSEVKSKRNGGSSYTMISYSVFY